MTDADRPKTFEEWAIGKEMTIPDRTLARWGWDARDAELAELKKELDDSETRNTTLNEWREEIKHLCGCEMDQHNSTCLVHWPAKQKLEATVADLRRQLAANDESLYRELQSAIRNTLLMHAGAKQEAAKLLEDAFTRCKRGTDALAAYVQERVDEAVLAEQKEAFHRRWTRLLSWETVLDNLNGYSTDCAEDAKRIAAHRSKLAEAQK